MIVQIEESKREEMAILCEQMLMAGGKLMSCIENLPEASEMGERSRMGMREPMYGDGMREPMGGRYGMREYDGDRYGMPDEGGYRMGGYRRR